MDLLEQIYQAGVVGEGGAGFPTHKKLDAKADYFIINGAECEPLLQTDKYIMRHHAPDIVEAVQAVGSHLKAKHLLIAVKKKYTDEITCLENEIQRQNAPVQLIKMDSFYPAGDEHITAFEASGLVVPPGGVPIAKGMVVSNVCTMMNVANAMAGRPVIRKLLSVLGEVNSPCIVDAPVGTSVIDCIAAAGGLSRKDVSLILGGPMMGRYVSLQEAESVYITKTTNGIIAVPEHSVPVKRKVMPFSHIMNQAKSMCIQCSYCTSLCPRYLLGHPIHPHNIMRAVSYTETGNDFSDNLYKEALICSECGVCEEYACPMGLSPRRVNAMIKDQLRRKGIVYDAVINDPIPKYERLFRKIPANRLTMRLGYARYQLPTLDQIIKIDPPKVQISLKQHIGIKAKPIVESGQNVFAGQIIACVDKEQLGANIHASIDGVISSINEEAISLERTGYKYV